MAPKKEYSAAERAAFGEKMKLARAARKLAPMYGPKNKPKPPMYGPKNKPKPRVYKSDYVARGAPLDMFDAIKHKKTCLALPNSLGDSICQDYVVRTTQVPSGSTPIYHIYTMTDSEVVGIKYTQSATLDAAITPITIAQFATDLPSTSRNSRMSISLLNTASGTAVAGTVSVAVVKNSLDWAFSASAIVAEVSLAFQASIQSIVDTGETSVVFTGKSCQEQPHQFSMVPTGVTNLTRWNQPVVVGSSVGALKLALINTIELGSHSTLIIRFDPVGSQSYNVAVNAQYGVRYPANTVLGNLGQRQPTVSAEVLQKHVDKAFDKSPVGRHQTVYI